MVQYVNETRKEVIYRHEPTRALNLTALTFFDFDAWLRAAFFSVCCQSLPGSCWTLSACSPAGEVAEVEASEDDAPGLEMFGVACLNVWALDAVVSDCEAESVIETGSK